MKKIYIYGAGKYGKLLYEILQGQTDISLQAFIDSNKRELKYYLGLPVEKPCQIKDNSARYIIAAQSINSVKEMARELIEKGITDIWFFDNNGQETTDFWQGNFIKIDKQRDTVLNHVEMHIMDACNLNCRGCTHFAPLFPKDIPDYSSRIEDVKTIAGKIDYIHNFYIMGGEPLLNPELDRYVVNIRKLFPHTRLYVVTNGLLIPKMKSELLYTIKENRVILSVSEYMPTKKIKSSINNILNKYGIMYEYRPYDEKKMFGMQLSLSSKSQHPHKCLSVGCVNIWNGMIARCPTVMYLHKFNEAFGTKLPQEGIYSLKELSGQEITELEKTGIPLCNHCVDYKIPWETCGRKVTAADFAVTD